MEKELFHKKLKGKIHQLVMLVYDITEDFPKSELYGSVSQLRRAVLSIMLNYVEGYARFRPKVKQNFYEISYGSVRECKYILYLKIKLIRLFESCCVYRESCEKLV